MGWVDLPTAYDKEEFERIKAAAKKIQSNSDVFVVIGISDGFYLRPVPYRVLKSDKYNDLRRTPRPFTSPATASAPPLWQNWCPSARDKDISINMISPLVFGRSWRKKYGKKAPGAHLCTTDKEGTLKHLADEEGYETFVVPDDVGGRYSVLTAVGLLPIAVSGADIDALMAGAAKAAQQYNTPSIENDCYKPMAIRSILRNRQCTEV